MIRINLLPYHERAKKENLRRQITIITGSIIVFFLLIVLIQIQISYKISLLEKEIKGKEARLVVLNREVGDVGLVKKEKMILEKKLSVIRNLDRDRQYPVRMLDDINIRMPAGQIWLEKLIQIGMEVRMEGVARDNTVVARFMKNLELSPYVQSVDLIVTRQALYGDAKLQRFNIQCVLKKGIS